MNRIWLGGVVLAFLTQGALAAPCSPAITSSVAADNGLTLTSACGTTRIEPWSDGIIRIRRLPAGAPTPRPSLIINGRRDAAAVAIRHSATDVVLETAALRLTISKTSGRIAFAKLGAAETFLSENDANTVAATGGLYRIEQAFGVRFGAGLHYYGLGQHPAGGLDWQKQSVHLQQANGDTGLPLLLSSGGWAILWDNASVTDVSVQRPAEGGQIVFASEAGEAIDYYLITGPNPDAIIAGYRRLTGAVPMLPRWAWGFWQSYEHYATADEIVGVAQQYRDRHIPIDGIIQDWQYWISGQWGAHTFDPARYRDPAGMVAAIHALKLHTIVSVWPRFDADTANRAELDAAHALFPETYSNVYPPGFGRWYDAFGHPARDLYWAQISRTLGRTGFDGWWLDGSEAELGGTWGQMRHVDTAAGPGALVYNAYPLLHTTAVFEGHRRDFPDRRPVILTRSAWAGQQRNGAISWSGDIHGDWETFRRQIPAGLNFVAAGIPYWNTDIGGFFAGNPADPVYAELFTRWFQYGAFTPMFRVHGTGKSKEMWRFPESTQAVLIRYDRLRYRLLPMIYSLSWSVTQDHSTMMRPLVFDFSADPAALDIADQFMFGPGLMVAPVTAAGAQMRTVYLPGNTAWYDFWTGKRLAPHQTIVAAAPIAILPLYVRAGTILPLGPAVEYAEAAPNAPLEIRVYRGADGHFALYDDHGDGWGYQRGEHAVIAMTWNDAEKTITFAARQGRYPGMKTAREFRIVFVDEDTGAGDQPATAYRAVTYTGRALVVRAP
jgi:alpha-D-xyloside xylohydrolase